MHNTSSNQKPLKVGDLVVTPFKNRWDLECVGTILALSEGAADVEVFNIAGPGANGTVNGIPLDKLSLWDG